MSGWAPVALRTAGVAGALLAVAVGCSFEGASVPPQPPPLPNELFTGCFRGDVVQPIGGGDATLVIEPEIGHDPANPLALSLRGCLDSRVQDNLIGQVSLTGMVVEAEIERANLSGVLSNGQADLDIDLEVVRSPAGEVPAESVTIVETNARFRIDVTEVCDSTIEELCPQALAVGRGGGV